MSRGVSNVSEDGSLVTWDANSFAQGVSRYAYKGNLYSIGQRPLKCVVKTLKDSIGHLNNEWTCIDRTYQCSARYAELFNNECSPRKKISFVKPIFLTVSRKTSGKIFSTKHYREGETVAAEPFIEGRYQKFNSNSGFFVNGHDVCQAFSHFTYARSGSSIVVCDLQGVENSNKYLLTDPAIISAHAGQYGCTDLGANGIQHFFKQHICNSTCQGLTLPPTTHRQNILSSIKNTIYNS